MNTQEQDNDWKLKLRYGRLQTPYRHFTAIAEGIAGSVPEELSCPPGNAMMAMKMWAESTDQAADMIKVIGARVGFEVTDDIQVFDTAPESPPKERPYGYDIQFTPFEEE